MELPIAIIAFVKESMVIFKSLSGIYVREVLRYGSLFEHTTRLQIHVCCRCA
jgi:hypothetical protein